MLSCMPNVERVELGWKERDGKITGRMAVKIYVLEKKADIADGERIPKTARVLVPAGKGIYKMRRIPTDVVWHAPAEFLAAPMPSPGDFLNPAPGGASIGVPPEFPGSFGCLVVDRQGRTFAITAGHV